MTDTMAERTGAEAARRAGYTEGLRQLADLLDADHDLQLPYTGTTGEILVIPLGAENQRAQLVAWARALARHGKLGRRTAEHFDGSSSFYLTGKVGGVAIQVIADRDSVCRWVVTGTEDREVEEVVRPAEVRRVVKPVETGKWVCEPVMVEPPSGGQDGTEAAPAETAVVA